MFSQMLLFMMPSHNYAVALCTLYITSSIWYNYYIPEEKCYHKQAFQWKLRGNVSHVSLSHQHCPVYYKYKRQTTVAAQDSDSAEDCGHISWLSNQTHDALKCCAPYVGQWEPVFLALCYLSRQTPKNTDVPFKGPMPVDSPVPLFKRKFEG